MKAQENGIVVITDAYGELRVKERILRAWRDAIVLSYGGMIPGHGYTTEEILGLKIWGRWGPGGRRFVGRCVAWMVRKRLVPIRRVTPIGKSPARYAR